MHPVCVLPRGYIASQYPYMSYQQQIPMVHTVQVYGGRPMNSLYPVYSTCEPPVIPFTQKPEQEEKPTDDLRQAIQSFVACLECAPDQTQAITSLSNRFNIKRRRLYDVINVLESIGACRKNGLDAVTWLGIGNMKATMQDLRRSRDIDNTEMTLEELFPAQTCIGISHLTISFLLLFGAVRTNRLDLRFVSQFFSHGMNRYKTTLCKLYQICYILCAIGVTKKTAQVCEVVLSEEYCDDGVKEIIRKKERETGSPSVMSIASLLNNSTKPNENKDNMEWLVARRKALQSCYIENVTDVHTFDIEKTAGTE